ncbi:hypothetical protein HNQ02_000691 [Flavobacterium sp. 7E]|uniref:hypothetical protein n=1 Tax=Flavobacterium sp. 7E TaxID=2735898 RepID=UPI0015709462|nr:hypothetical protein [Flavobacterium sp. 7E]NRS87784.1 hypothetical protein [Flavobacterium sp. 7E]
MELYIEKAFFDKFNDELKLDFKSKGKTVLAAILKTYGDVNLLIDYALETSEELNKFNIDFFEVIPINNPIIPVKSIKAHFFDFSKCEQTLIFSINNEDWFEEAEQKGALCFSYENFEQKIEYIITLCDNLKVDLSEDFAGWDFFRELKTIPKNEIIINDGYLFAENSGNKPVEENLIPLLKNISANHSTIKVDFFTNYMNSKKPSEFIDLDKIKRKLLNVFKSDYNLSFEYIQYHSHDRILYSNFFLIGCGVGFNFNTSKKSNSIITVDSVFNKFNYKRINNHIRDFKMKRLISIVQ